VWLPESTADLRLPESMADLRLELFLEKNNAKQFNERADLTGF